MEQIGTGTPREAEHQPASSVQIALESWQAELLDLSKANLLLYFKPARTLQLSAPSPDLLFESLVNHGRALTVYRTDDQGIEEDAADEQLTLVLEAADEATTASPSEGTPLRPARLPRADEIVLDGEPKKIQASLYRYRLRSRAMDQEQGITVLYVAFGLLDWTETEASSVRIQSPLVLAPVRLERDTALDPYRLVPIDEPPVLNPALHFKLERDFGLTLTLPAIDDADVAPLPAILTHIRQAIAAQPDWQVIDNAVLGLFSFAKQAMYEDLARHHEVLSQHPLVRAVAQEVDGLPEPVAGLLRAEDLDDRVSPAETFQVLDADASQQEAIAAVNAGASLVIQGPPGTGKSQTITNIIAESLAQHKTVLFVSEKMTALEVVERRLRLTGLGEFILKAHSQGIDKAAIVRDLHSTLEAGRAVRADTSAADLATLTLHRQQLNGYVRALHDADSPLGLSAYQVHGQLAQLEGATVIPFALSDIGALTPQRLVSLRQTVQRLQQSGAVLLAEESHPWRGTTLNDASLQVQAALRAQFTDLERSAVLLAADQSALRAQWQLGSYRPNSLAAAPDSWSSAAWLREVLTLLQERPRVPRSWLGSNTLAELLTVAGEHRDRSSTYRLRRTALMERYAPAVFSLSLRNLEARMRQGGSPHAERVRSGGIGSAADRVVRQRAALDPAAVRLHQALIGARTAAADVAQRLGLPAPTTLTDARRMDQLSALVAQDPRPTSAWLTAGELAAAVELAHEVERLYGAVAENRTALEGRFESEIIETLDADLCQAFETTYSGWLRWLKGAYRRDLARLRALQTDPKASFGHGEALTAVKQARRLASAQTKLADRRAALAETFGPHFLGATTDWPSLQASMAAMQGILDHFPGVPLPAALTHLLQAPGVLAAIRPYTLVLHRSLTELDDALGAFQQYVSLDDLPAGPAPAEEQEFSALEAWCVDWLAGVRDLWTAVDAVQAHRLPTTDRTEGSVEQLAADLLEAEEILALETDLLRNRDELAMRFGHLFQDLNTHWDEVLDDLGWTQQLQTLVGAAPAAFFDQVAGDFASAPADLDRIAQILEAVTAAIEQLRPSFAEAAFRVQDACLEDVSLEVLGRWSRDFRGAIPQLEAWIDLATAREKATEAGLGAFVQGLLRTRPGVETWTDVFLRQVYTLWLTWRQAETPALGTFRGEAHEAVIRDFQSLDRGQWRTTSARISARLVPERPVLTLNVHPRSELAILAKEATKKKRFRPLRKLFADLPSLLPALKPCILMSPLSVAQFLGESAISFDVVIFDEASQILPADAIGSIARGKQLVVVGDQKQLPPTRFFAASTTVAEDDEEEVPESVLDACLAARLPTKQLLWHYRSRHEDLIAFSNRWFYDRRLVTFPSPDSDHRAVEFVHVSDGIYDRASQRINRVEARHMVDLVIEQVERHPGQSLGVITFSEAQMVAIQTELDARKRARPELEELLRETGEEGFFVKNLEYVQGDERDVIFFSVGYGPDAAGNFTMNFGPLNREGGERRLNVAVTRARGHVKILASFLPYQIDLNRTQAKGVHLLRRYLEFAEQGPKALLGEITAEGGEFDSPFEMAVATALEARGLRVVAQVGVGGFRIDLGIKDEQSDRYLLGVECDGATYHSSKTARDRDRLRQEILENLGWRVHRIWSTDWLKAPDREIEKVLDALERARTVLGEQDGAMDWQGSAGPEVAAPECPSPAEPSPSHPEGTCDEAETSPRGRYAHLHIVPGPGGSETAAVERGRQVPPYQSVQFHRYGDLEQFKVSTRSQLALLVEQCVNTEGPVHEDRLMREIASAFDIGRVGHLIRSQLTQAIAQAEENKLVERRGPFLWKPGQHLIVRGPATDGSVRQIREIAPEEIAEAALGVLADTFALNRDDLVVATARDLGYDRTGAQVSQMVGEVVDSLVTHGRLLDAGGQLRVAPTPSLQTG